MFHKHHLLELRAGDGDRTRDVQGRKTPVFHHVSRPERPTCQSNMSVLRPVTFLACRAFTSTTSIPFDSKIWQTGIQYTPVDSMATVSMPQWFNQSASSCRSAVKVANFRTGSGSRLPTSTQISLPPTSIPAAAERICGNLSSNRRVFPVLLMDSSTFSSIWLRARGVVLKLS